MSSANAEALSASSTRTIYEVIRVISGVPLFLEKHMERLEASAKLLGCTLVTSNIKGSIYELIKANGSPDKNIKVIVYNLDSNTPDHMVYFIHSSYPAPEEYEKGVHGTLLKEERSNPNAKIVNTSYKERVAEHLSRTKAYEALLVNSSNEITEGSRSNVFFVKNGTVITAPRGNVLIGITRVCVVELCRKLNIEVLEKPVSLAMLAEIDGVFMSGTSPKLLPISTIDDMSFGSADNPVIKALMKGYDDMLKEYIADKNH
jgi:branched-chain amino acid aminotransferase